MLSIPSGDAIDFFMVLLSLFGLVTPSLRLRKSNSPLHSEKSNTGWDTPPFTVSGLKK